MSATLVLIRHGQSTFNAENRFTGLTDAPLTACGLAEADRAGAQLAGEGLSPAVIFTSALDRTIQSGQRILAHTGGGAELISAEALNERDYGELTGLNKAEAEQRYGAVQVAEWRRSYRNGPPAGENLRDTVARVAPYYAREILPSLLERGSVVVVGHGNSHRALAFALEGMTEAAVADLEFITGQAVLYRIGPSGRLLGPRRILR